MDDREEGAVRGEQVVVWEGGIPLAQKIQVRRQYLPVEYDGQEQWIVKYGVPECGFAVDGCPLQYGH